MKYFLTLTLIFSGCLLTAQSVTTLDEYRYLSKGYAYQLEMGLDPAKNGYEIRKNYMAKNGTSIIGLYHINAKIPQGLLFVTTDANGKSFYRAIPNPQSADNVLALYRQDQTQLPTAVRHKMTEAKDHYLFSIPTNGQSANLARTNPGYSKPAAKYSQKSTSERPTSYEALPAEKSDQFTTKGGTPIIVQEKISTPSPRTTSPTKTKKGNLGGSTITGQLNSALNSRTILVQPYAQNTTTAKGRLVIKFCANAEGTVTYAKFTQKGSTTLNSGLKTLALDAVRKMQLAPTSGGEDCGTVGFDF